MLCDGLNSVERKTTGGGHYTITLSSLANGRRVGVGVGESKHCVEAFVAPAPQPLRAASLEVRLQALQACTIQQALSRLPERRSNGLYDFFILSISNSRRISNVFL